MSLTVMTRFESKPGMEDRLRTELEAMIEPSLEECGAISYEPYVDPNNPRQMLVVEEWADLEALEFHLTTPHLQQAAELFDEILIGSPDISVGHVRPLARHRQRPTGASPLIAIGTCAVCGSQTVDA